MGKGPGLKIPSWEKTYGERTGVEKPRGEKTVVEKAGGEKTGGKRQGGSTGHDNNY